MDGECSSIHHEGMSMFTFSLSHLTGHQVREHLLCQMALFASIAVISLVCLLSESISYASSAKSGGCITMIRVARFECFRDP
jgi:hypothetical protein